MEIPSWSFAAIGEYLFNVSGDYYSKTLAEESDLCTLDILYSGWIHRIHEIFI